jgi:hypothetical protein
MKTAWDIRTVFTSRDLAVLRALVIARVLDGAQIQLIARFTSVRRTNRRLLKLVRAGVLRRWFVGTASGGQKAIYGHSPAGARLLEEPTHGLITWKQDALITTSQFLAHQQAINRVFIRARYQPLREGCSCAEWQTFRRPISPSIPLVPDGYFEIVYRGVVHPMFLEADLGNESSMVWKRKVELYLKLGVSKEFEHMFDKTRLRVLVVVSSDRRMNALRRVIAQRTDKLFWFTTEDRMELEGLCGPIWMRPKVNELITLL